MAKILIIDDEASIRTMLKDILSQDEHDIMEAENGAIAYELCQQNNFDLIITDLVMPEKSGIDLIMELKGKQPDLRIVAISGGGGITGRFDYLPIAKLIGANVILSKPFHVSEIRTAITEVLAA